MQSRFVVKRVCYLHVLFRPAPRNCEIMQQKCYYCC